MTPAEFLTVEEARQAILARMAPVAAEEVPLAEALGRVLAEAVTAGDSLPPFDNSAMDGYAVRAADVAGASAAEPVKLRVVGDIAAGQAGNVVVEATTAARIMTGAPLPPGADAIVPVEDTDEPWREAERPLPLRIEVRRSVGTGDYVRRAGEDVTSGQQVLPAGRLLRPQELGLLASLGADLVTVVGRPRVGILATGDELVEVSQALTPGKIRNSNSYAQAAQVKLLGGFPVNLGVAQDTEADVRAKLALGLASSLDLFVSSAGVSVGAYDVVKAVLEQDGDVGFWRVRMRPGKPLAFGSYGGVPYLGLPGNPVSAVVSFEVFARPAILKLGGRNQLERPRVMATVMEAIRSDGRESYVRAVVRREGAGYVAETTGGQGSHMMTSLTKANALLVVPEGIRAVAAGEQLAALMIDWPETVF